LFERGGMTQAQRMSNEPRYWTLKPIVRHQVIMGGIGAMFIGLGTWFVASGFQSTNMEILAGLVCASLGGFILATVVTTQLVLTPEHLVARALWRTQWSIPRQRVEIRALASDPSGPPSGLAIIDIEGGKVMREIPTGQFSASDMRRLAEIFAPRG
jgi:hypothetical protein